MQSFRRHRLESLVGNAAAYFQCLRQYRHEACWRRPGQIICFSDTYGQRPPRPPRQARPLDPSFYPLNSFHFACRQFYTPIQAEIEIAGQRDGTTGR